MILLQDGVEVLCPIGCETCAGDCFYYDEDLN